MVIAVSPQLFPSEFWHKKADYNKVISYKEKFVLIWFKFVNINWKNDIPFIAF